MRIIALVGTLALLGAGCATVGAPGRQDAALKLFMQGVLYETDGLMEEALASYRKAAGKDASSTYLTLKVGTTALQQKKMDEARRAFERVLREEPDSGEALTGMGLVFFYQNDLSSAAQYLERALAVDPDRLALRVMLTDIYMSQRNYAAALPHYARIVREVPGNPLFRFNYGLALEGAGRSEEARKEIQEAIDRAPRFSRGYTSLGSLLEKAGKVDEARTAYRKALEINPDDGMVWILYANTYLRQREYGRAKEILLDAAGRGVAQQEIHHLLGAIASDEGQYETALVHFRTALAAGETDRLWFTVGVVHDKLKQRPQMEEAMKKAIELNPDNAAALNYLGYSYLVDRKNIDEAYQMIRRAVEMDPDNGAYLDSLGWAYFLKGDLRSAQKYLERAASLESDPEVFEHLGHLYAAKNDYPRAVLWFAKSLELQRKPEVQQELEKILRLLRK